MRVFVLLLLSLAALVGHQVTADAAQLTPCQGGPFLVQSQPLLGNGAEDSDKVYIAGTEVSTASGCPPVRGTVRATSKGTKVRVKWSSCGSIPGPYLLTALIDPATCGSMQGTLKTRGVNTTRVFSATRQTDPCTDENADTFELIEERIFASHGCNVSTCHGPSRQGDLDLRSGAAYGDLVDVAAANVSAQTAGKKRVLAGDAASSFLSQKLHGLLGPGEGALMPLVGSPLTQPELDLVDAWINGGAPETGAVPGAPCLPPQQYVPSNPPRKPKGGYQIFFDGPVLQPGEEQEGCYWIPQPNKTTFYSSRWEFVLNPGTHHFAVFNNRDDVPSPPLKQWLLNDFGCAQEATYGATISAATQSPYFVDDYPTGVARALPAGKFLGLNAHYHNGFDVPIRMRVWVNIYPYKGTPQHVAQTLTSLDATYSIDVPPFTQKVQHGRFVNASGVPMSFIQLSGHMHKRGLRFTARSSAGAVLYDSFDWAHALASVFDPPFVLQPSEWIDYECLEDNGVTRPLKLDAFGNPTDLRFGVTTDDEMCVLPASYYTP